MDDWDKLMDPARNALESLIAKGDEMADSIEELEAKLAKAVEALDKIKRIDNLVGVFAACERTLAELTGGKDE